MEKCKAVGKNVVQCVVDPWFPNQPECKCHLGYKTSEAGICVGMDYNFSCSLIGQFCGPYFTARPTNFENFFFRAPD